MKYKELLNQLQHLSKEQLELETLVFIRDKEKFVSLNNGLFFVTEFDEYEEDLETDQPYFSVSFVLIIVFTSSQNLMNTKRT